MHAIHQWSGAREVSLSMTIRQEGASKVKELFSVRREIEITAMLTGC